jgi:hypothetical protein
MEFSLDAIEVIGCGADGAEVQVYAWQIPNFEREKDETFHRRKL